LTDSVGGQTAADPDHRSANGATDASLLPAGRDESLPTGRLALLAPALPLDLNVVGMDQHLEITSFLSGLESVVVVGRVVDVVVERATGMGHEHVV
jgi:hypothetical protein